MNSPEDTVARYHRMASANAEAPTPELAHAVLRFGRWLGESGRHEDAVLLIGDAITLFRALAEADVRLFSHSIAGALVSRSSCLVEAGREPEALAASEEALSICKKGTEHGSLPHAERMAQALDEHVRVRLRTGTGLAEAESTVRGCLATYQQWITMRRGDVSREIQLTRRLLARLLDRLGRPAEAVAILPASGGGYPGGAEA
jgi:hypothetical protein